MPYNCGYTIEVGHKDKKPFLVGSFSTVRLDTEQATEASAAKYAEEMIDKFWSAHFPDDAPRPTVVKVRLGHMTFVPDDYEWCRG